MIVDLQSFKSFAWIKSYMETQLWISCTSKNPSRSFISLFTVIFYHVVSETIYHQKLPMILVTYKKKKFYHSPQAGNNEDIHIQL